MMKTVAPCFVLMWACIQTAGGQTASEALRLSTSRPEATARAMAMGSAFSAVGADYTAVAVNPAGVAFFRKGDATIGLKVQHTATKATLQSPLGSSNAPYDKDRNKLAIEALGVVGVTEPRNFDWSTLNFSLQVHRSADFSQGVHYVGKGTGSITDRFLELSLDPQGQGLEGIHPDDLDPFEAGLAFEAGALYDLGSDPDKYLYHTDLLDHPGYQLEREQRLKLSRGLHEISLNVGGLYREWLAVGAGIQIPLGSFSSRSEYYEREEVAGSLAPFRKLRFDSELTTRVAGIGMKAGVIVRPLPFLRLGASLQSPYALELRDQYSTAHEYTFVLRGADTTISVQSPEGEFKYNLFTPWKAVLSGALVLPYGLITVDADWYDPRNASYRLTTHSDDPGDSDRQRQINADIDKQYQAVWQYRLGAELALGHLRLRGGHQWLEQPYRNASGWDRVLSFGLGYRANRFYLDFACAISQYEQSLAPYLTGESDFNGDGKVDAVIPLVDQEIERTQLMVTLGWKL